MKRVAVLQSNYLPWKGYFHIIHDVDVFVFYDDVQFTKNDWRNRNRIKTAQGSQWISIPVGQTIDRLICDVRLPDDPRWAERHWRTLEQNYRRAPFFDAYAPLVERALRREKFTHLSELNQHLVTRIARDALGLVTQFKDSRGYELAGKREDRLLELLRREGATEYVSGPAARAYLDEARFAAEGIAVRWMSYAGYREYAQFHPPFDHFVTVLDLLFHVGPAAAEHVWGSPGGRA